MDLVKIIGEGKEAKKKDEDILQEVYCILLERFKNMKIEEFSSCVKLIEFCPANTNYSILLEISSNEL